MKNEIILIGGGGHCHSCIDVIEQSGQFVIRGIVDQEKEVGEMVLGYPVIGKDDDIPLLIKKYEYALITVGQIKTAQIRMDIYSKLVAAGAKFPVIISPRAYVSKHSKVGEGTIIMHDAIINSNCVIGRNCIINTKSLCEHDSTVGDFCHISTGAIINGHCTIGSGAFIGSNSVLKESSSIKDCSVIPYGEKR